MCVARRNELTQAPTRAHPRRAHPQRAHIRTHTTNTDKTIKMVKTKRCENLTLDILKSMEYVLKNKGRRIWKQADGGIREENSRLFYDIMGVFVALKLVTKNKRPGYAYMRRGRKDNYYLNAPMLRFLGAELNESFSVGKATNEFLEKEKAKIQSQKLEEELLSAEEVMEMDMEDTDEDIFDCFNPADKDEDVVDCFNPAKNLFDC